MKKLNKEQLQAIKHTTGPLLVIAGAGTGKTTVITERVKFLIEKNLARTDEILALTFTEKAAREMEERIDIALPYGYTNMWIMTFHSFCERVLRQNALQIGLDPRFKLMTETQTIQLIRENIFDFKLKYFRPLTNPNKFIEGMIQHFSRLQDEDIDSTDYVSWARKLKTKTQGEKQEREKYLELANAYRTYEELKIKNGLMDFGDLITKTLKLFRDRPNILREYRQQFKYVLIDEFQDTNFAQNCLAILLAQKQNKTDKENIMVVGDDDQSVYRFRGAAVSNILQFRKNFPKTKVVTLTKNYRSTQIILDGAYKLIQNNNPDRLEAIEKIDKKLVSQRKKLGNKIDFIYTDRVENEADGVAKEINKLAKKYDYKDFAILVRANNHSEPFVRALSRHNIPFQFLGPGRLFAQSEIIDLISYLKVLYNFEDSAAFYRILNMSIFEINARDIAKLLNSSRKYNISLFETSEKISETEISDDSKTKVKNIVEMVHNHLGLVSKESAGQILFYFLQESGIYEELNNAQSAEAQKRANNISKFFDKIKTFETANINANLFRVVDYIELSSEVGESPLAADSDWGDVNAVNILTVHSAKGLEFPVVFLVNLVSQRFPTTERHEQIPIPIELIKETLPSGDYHLQEERRLFYVGMTRARDKLYLSAANYYGEGKRDKKLSMFISEALGELPQNVKQQTKVQNSFLDYTDKKEFIEEKKNELKINYLSYSQIETFKICPMHFKLKYILKVPSAPSASQSFGITIHKTLEEFCKIAKTEKQNVKNIFAIYKKNWINQGFVNKKQEKEFYKKGKSYLEDFLKQNEILIEKGQANLLETNFIIPISKTLKIGGKIDRVDVLSDKEIEIWDYKTGMNIPTQKEVDRDLQLTIYAIAASSINEKPFGIEPEKVKLSLYYFETQTKITTTRTKSDLIKAKEEILKIRDEIERSDFKCNNGFFCQNCEYRMFCRTEAE